MTVLTTLDIGSGCRPKGDINIDLPQRLRPNFKPVAKRPNFIEADLYHLPFRDNCFEHLFCSHVLEHLTDPMRALREMKRVKSPKGQLEIWTPSLYEITSSTEHIFSWSERHLYNLLSLVFEQVHTRYTMTGTIIRGRLGIYFSFLNLVLSRLGIKKELYALVR